MLQWINKMADKTNAARILDRLNIKYSLVEYSVDPDHLEATHVAEKLGEDISSVFKTLVLEGDKTATLYALFKVTNQSISKRLPKSQEIKKLL